jgi:hypothetical protein
MRRADEKDVVPMDIEDIHLVFKTHLDVGFTDFARNVVGDYFTCFVPRALRVAEVLRQAERPERLVWTTGSWLIYEYLEQAEPAARRRMEAAITAGDIAWHGLPFTTHSELMDPELFACGLGLARELDRRFGRETIAAKMTDVPGHTRGIVPRLAEAGIRFLHIGVNPASTAPEVPPVFVWRDAGGAEVIVMYDQHYGGFGRVPGSPAALAIEHTDDNAGPPTIDAVVEAFDRHRTACPTARIAASTLDAFARAIVPLQDRLPVVTAEIGDTWIHGVGSDPTKVSRLRELCRLRRQWLAAGDLQVDDPGLGRFSRFLLMVPEHTWGLDTKKHLGDWVNYDAARFGAARGLPHFRHFAASWDEQRAYLDAAVAALGDAQRTEATEHLARLEPRRPEPAKGTPVPTDDVEFETAHFRVRFDRQHGAMVGLEDKATGRRWASSVHPLGLVRYDTFGAADYERFMDQYVVPAMRQEAWVLRDQGKPGLEAAGATRQTWFPMLAGLFRDRDGDDERVLLELTMPDEASAVYGAPRRLTVELDFPKAIREVRLTVQWFDKPACRLPEAVWCSFVPSVAADGGGWLEKMGQWVASVDVVRRGNRRLHAVGAGVEYRDGQDRLMVETLDAPLVAVGAPALLEFSGDLPQPKDGVHVNLFNNVWGTNFPQWFGEDARFRFVLRPAKASAGG